MNNKTEIPKYSVDMYNLFDYIVSSNDNKDATLQNALNMVSEAEESFELLSNKVFVKLFAPDLHPTHNDLEIQMLSEDIAQEIEYLIKELGKDILIADIYPPDKE